MGTLVAACDQDATNPDLSDPEPQPEPLVISYMAGAPTNINWGAPLVVTAFFPEQRGWEWVTGAVAAGTRNEMHPGASAVRAGTPCLECHSGDGPNGARGLGRLLVLKDPEPIAGKEGHKNIEIQAAYDAENFYLKARWPAARPGITHETYRFDGAAWVPNSRHKPDPLGANEHYSYEDRFAVMIADRNVRADPSLPANVGFETVGCWMTCHTNMRDMPEAEKGAEAMAFIGKSEVRKWLPISREDGKLATSKLGTLRAEGQFLDLWQFRASRGGPVNTPSDDQVLEFRDNDIGGSTAFFDQMPNDMRWMYDRSKLGFVAIPLEKYEEHIEHTPLISEGPLKNAVPFDQNAGFAAGDILPRRVLRPASGNRGDLTSYSEWKDGFWTVIIKRRQRTDYMSGATASDKPLTLAGGEVYTLGFSVHDEYTTTRRHFVSFPVTLGNEQSIARLKARAN